ncbi:MAG: phosphate-starvation-inducible PsiE family protein [Sulfurimonas sp.]|uniref:phosphate-starvation-inducible PsiE family protein n=1 Tax=Sulfurimonas sp. TaxID=2022749 RepID=UPI003D1094AC
MRDFFKKYTEIITATLIFLTIFTLKYDFYKVIILMLEFIVIIEVVKMISDFILKRKLRLRFVIDVFIIFLIRDVIILSTHKVKEYNDILFLLFVIFVFFIFRIFAIRYSPTQFTNSKSLKERI